MREELDHIAEQIGVNLTLQPRDLDFGEFQARGGRLAVLKALGPNWTGLLDELNTALAA